MRKVVSIIVCIVMLVSVLGGCNKPKEVQQTPHVHSYADGKSSCGKYEVEFLTRTPIPNTVATAIEKGGTVERLTYSTHSYAIESVEGGEVLVEKELLVYLPYGYDKTKQYDILYLLHGTEEVFNTAKEYWLGDSGTGKTTKNVLDNMMASGLAKPTIVVAPTYYSLKKDHDGNLVEDKMADVWPIEFYQEFRQDIVPLVEKTYSTYASGDTSLDNFQATRQHRAMAGLSRGAMTTMNSGMIKSTDIIGYFGSFSGVWADYDAFNAALNVTFAQYPIYYWYNSNGSADFALENHKALTDKALKEMSNKFVDGKNYAFTNFAGGAHAYNCWIVGLYNSMLVFFK